MGTKSGSPEDHLEQACKKLRRASDAAGRTVQNQADSIVEGLSEELDGVRTQEGPEPKADSVGELAEKLDGLEAEAEAPASDHIAAARDHCREYLRWANETGQ